MVAGHEEDGTEVPVVEFDFEAVDRELAPRRPRRRDCGISCEVARDASIRMLHESLEWSWQDGPKNVNGLLIRSAILHWVFLPQVATCTLTEMAAMINRDKQSLGRWFDDFKRRFPYVRTAHMRIK